jgi:hypothetical protein
MSGIVAPPTKTKTDPIVELVADVFNAFDAEEADDAMVAEFVQGCLDTARSRKLDADLATLMPRCARVLGMTEAAARAAYQSVKRGAASASEAGGTPDELAALAALRATPGRHGATFSESAAKVIAKAWPRLAGPAFGKAMFAGAKDLRLTNLGALTTLAGIEASRDVTWLEITVAPSCDLAPLASLTKLGTLVVTGRLAGYAPLARLARRRSRLADREKPPGTVITRHRRRGRAPTFAAEGGGASAPGGNVRCPAAALRARRAGG